MIVAIIVVLGSVTIGGLVGFVAWFFSDRHEQHAADHEYGRIWPARTFRLAVTDLPYLAAGSYHRAAPRVIRSGPLFPLDVAAREEVMLPDSDRFVLPHVQEPVLSARVTGAPNGAPNLDVAAPGPVGVAGSERDRPGARTREVVPPALDLPAAVSNGRANTTQRPLEQRPPAADDTTTIPAISDDSLPEWLDEMLHGDLIAAIARDKAHCARMAVA